MRSPLGYFLSLFRSGGWRLALGVLLFVIALLVNIALLTLSGWFLAASALAGMSVLQTFNYMLPAAGLRAAAMVRTAARYAERLVSHDATFRILQNLRVFSFRKLLPLTPANIMNFQQADLLNRFVADIDTLDHLYLRLASPVLGALVVILCVTLGLYWFDMSLALMLGGILLLMLFLPPPALYLAGRANGEALVEHLSQYRIQLTHWLQGQAELSLYDQSAAHRARLDCTERQWQKAQRQQVNFLGISQAITVLVSGISVILMFWFSADMVSHEAFSGELGGAIIALFVFCTLAAFEALLPINTAFLHLGKTIHSAVRVSMLLEQKAAVHFLSELPKEALKKEKGIQFQDVSFRYPHTPLPVLKQICLQVMPGEQIALLGPTGCGKTTVLQLLTRAWDPEEGAISINGVSLRQWDEAALRAEMTVVTQRVHLFNQTLRDNLLFAAPDSSDERLCETLKDVGLGKLLSTSEGLNAWLGEGGRQLSGGELRRLAIARALLHQGNILLLDEPTEGLDRETENQILSLLYRVSRGKTLIMVTHQLRGLEQMDKIYVIDQGKILQQNDRDALL